MLNKTDENIKLRLQMAQNKELLDITDISLLTGFSASLIRKRISDGKLVKIQNVPNGKILCKRTDVNRWLNGGREDV